MSEHRLQEYFDSSVAVATAVATPEPAFVPCPVMPNFVQSQLAFVTEIYRLAREMTLAQLAKPKRTWPPAFSLN